MYRGGIENQRKPLLERPTSVDRETSRIGGLIEGHGLSGGFSGSLSGVALPGALA